MTTSIATIAGLVAAALLAVVGSAVGPRTVGGAASPVGAQGPEGVGSTSAPPRGLPHRPTPEQQAAAEAEARRRRAVRDGLLRSGMEPGTVGFHVHRPDVVDVRFRRNPSWVLGQRHAWWTVPALGIGQPAVSFVSHDRILGPEHVRDARARRSGGLHAVDVRLTEAARDVLREWLALGVDDGDRDWIGRRPDPQGPPTPLALCAVADDVGHGSLLASEVVATSPDAWLRLVDGLTREAAEGLVEALRP